MGISDLKAITQQFRRYRLGKLERQSSGTEPLNLRDLMLKQRVVRVRIE